MSVESAGVSLVGIQERLIIHPSISIISFSGTPGAGKNFSAGIVQEEYPEIEMMRSITTRPRRSESQDFEYVFVSREEFEDRRDRGEFLWTQEKFGNRYGTLRKDVDDALGKRHASLMHIVHETVQKLQMYVEGELGRPGVLSILVTCFDADLLRRRMVGRVPETPELDSFEKAKREQEIDDRVSGNLLRQKKDLESGRYHYHFPNDGTFDKGELRDRLLEAISQPIPKRRTFRMCV